MPPAPAGPPPTVSANNYRITMLADRPYALLEDAKGSRLAELFLFSGVNAESGRDDTTWTGEWRLTDEGDHQLLECQAGSSVWKLKTYRLRCWPDRFTYEIEVEGEGRLDSIDYFGGYSSARLRWGSGFFWSGSAFLRGFNPEPTGEERYHFPPSESSLIDTTGVPIQGRDSWFFTPPPFAYAFELDRGWLSMGVEARPGWNLYNELHYRAQRSGFHLSLPFESRPALSGRTLLPAIGFDFAEDEYAALASHVEALQRSGLTSRGSTEPSPRWWSSPIFCGWGAQCHLAALDGGQAPAYATEANYRTFLASLAGNGLEPGTVVLDDKWQRSYGENDVDESKWPDLRGFVAEQHRAGRRVLLWLKAWDPEGVPADECVVNAAGEKVAVDPTNPAFQGRFRASLRRMLSSDGYDADGFKLDFTARIPASPGLRVYDPAVWGLELMRSYLRLIHDEAKRVKSDALIMTHTPHPYLADLIDMVRLNDINVGHDVRRTMTHRARIARIACPEALVDTDNWPVTDRESWRAYLELQPLLGVVSLYYASHIDKTGEPLLGEDYLAIRAAWAGSDPEPVADGRGKAGEQIA